MAQAKVQFTRVSVGAIKVGDVVRISTKQGWSEKDTTWFDVAETKAAKVGNKPGTLLVDTQGREHGPFSYPQRFEVTTDVEVLAGLRGEWTCTECGFQYAGNQPATGVCDDCTAAIARTAKAAPAEKAPEAAKTAEAAKRVPAGRKLRTSMSMKRAMYALQSDEADGLTRADLHADPMIVKSLVARGWVTCTRDGDDRSVDWIELTAEGAIQCQELQVAGAAQVATSH